MGLASNAKKDSIRADVAKYLKSLYEPPPADSKIVVPKNKAHVNPYLDYWAWSNQNLEWGGPETSTARVKHSHATLPVVYHHFGCICPTYEALTIVHQLSWGKRVVDLGSGNGYWTYMLRRIGEGKKRLEVVPVDNGISEWRTMWVGDTVEMDGKKWLETNDGGRDAVLLLVYPQVGLEFTSNMLKAYSKSTRILFRERVLTGRTEGTTIVVAGTQNTNGFTAFKEELISDWIAREMPGWHKLLQIPLPSFAGKDEALFAFEKKAGENGTAGP